MVIFEWRVNGTTDFGGVDPTEFMHFGVRKEERSHIILRPWCILC